MCSSDLTADSSLGALLLSLRRLMRYCLHFRRGIPHQEVDDPRVTHPYATVLRIAPFLVRLACVKRAASVDSEPGSNSRLNL